MSVPKCLFKFSTFLAYLAFLDRFVDFLDSKDSEINLSNKSLSVIVLSGLQGSGKTTTAAKLAGFLKREFNKQAMLIGLDLQRPAATEQLKILAENNNLSYYIESDSKDVIKVLNNGMEFAKKQNVDISNGIMKCL